jgi:hypothetical protein
MPKTCRTTLTIKGADPDEVSRLLWVAGRRIERRDGVKVLEDLWMTWIGGPNENIWGPGEQIQYWYDFLAANEDAVREVIGKGAGAYIDCSFWGWTANFNLSAEMMRCFGKLGVEIRFRFADYTSSEMQYKPLNPHLVVRQMQWSGKAAGHLRQQLYESEIAQKIRETLDPGEGSFFAVVPEGMDPNEVQYWDGDEDAIGYPQDPHSVLCDVVEKFLREPRSRVLGLYPYSLSEPVDPSIRNVVRYHDQNAMELRGPEVVRDEVEECVYHVSPFPSILYFYRTDSPKRGTLDDAAVAEISTNLVGLAVGALHEHTFLIWWRTDITPFPGDLEGTTP